MLRIAVPNKGTLSTPAAQMLRDAGYRQRSDTKDLVCRDEANNVEFFYLRPRDIATYVGTGDLDLGITGRDLLVDSGVPVNAAKRWLNQPEISAPRRSRTYSRFKKWTESMRVYCTTENLEFAGQFKEAVFIPVRRGELESDGACFPLAPGCAVLNLLLSSLALPHLDTAQIRELRLAEASPPAQTPLF